MRVIDEDVTVNINTKFPATEKNWEEIQALSEECLFNKAMHNAAAANFLASEGLLRLIHEKKEITSARDQLLAEQEQNIARLSELEAKAAEVVVLEARLQQSEQEVVTLSQEIGPLRDRFDKARAKWVEVHNVVLAATEREAASAKRVTNLEVALNSKIEELVAVGAKHAKMEEKYVKTIEHNRLFS
ncbi:uncharacterized protein [Nicotiana tomentosiformis]|uniref:uncharacterized protein n=1 Tax=Nicotiana tomentosiformis TaxID=4098 RepID=UPI00388C5A91